MAEGEQWEYEQPILVASVVPESRDLPFEIKQLHPLGREFAGMKYAPGQVLAISSLSNPYLGAEFLPKLDEGAIAINVNRLPSVSLSEAARMSNALE